MIATSALHRIFSDMCTYFQMLCFYSVYVGFENFWFQRKKNCWQRYEEIKREIYKKYPQHSAYRSGLLVQEYKRRGGRYSGTKDKKEGLTRWFAEDWRNQRGGVGYDKKGDVYRPTKRITKDTPTTFKQLSKKEIEKAQREKKRTGKVKRF